MQNGGFHCGILIELHFMYRWIWMCVSSFRSISLTLPSTTLELPWKVMTDVFHFPVDKYTTFANFVSDTVLFLTSWNGYTFCLSIGCHLTPRRKSGRRNQQMLFSFILFYVLSMLPKFYLPILFQILIWILKLAFRGVLFFPDKRPLYCPKYV